MQQHVYAIAKACAEMGITHVVICPGSRSAPLVKAFTQYPFHCTSVVDERSAGYIGLGMAQQLKQPVVLICTSGTAALNFYPAIAEAFYQQIPLLILTADRPAEFLNQQDGQMIHQQGVYGNHVLQAYSLPCYVEGGENHEETYSIVREAIEHAAGNSSKKAGPVHINIPLREPLYEKGRREIPKFKPIPFKSKSEQSELPNLLLLQAIQTSAKKMLIIGQMAINPELMGLVTTIGKLDDWVIVTDILSNLHHLNTANQFDYMCLRADKESLAAMQPDCIVSLGGPVLSKSLKVWLSSFKPSYHFRLNLGDTRIDTYKNVTHHFQGDPLLYLRSIAQQFQTQKSHYKQFWQAMNQLVCEAQSIYFKESFWNEFSVLHQLLDIIPDAVNVHVANSSIIRYASYLGKLNPSWVVSGNRGTSGIDGSTSTAVGSAMVNNRETFLLTGDLAFLYDINALWNGLPNNLKIIVWNNGGGGIFQLIDGPGAEPAILPYFTTPYQQSLALIAQHKNIAYAHCDSFSNWKEVKKFFANTNKPAILELTFNKETNASDFKQFKKIKL